MPNIFAIVGTAVKFLAKPATAVLNKLPAGTATGVGVATAVAGAAAAAVTGNLPVVNAGNIVEIIREVGVIIVGVVVAIWGAGRAAGRDA